jgi:putative hydrolase of the HAD superfamily
LNIRAVFFDFGGVIQRTEFQTPRQRLAERFGMEYGDLDQLVFQSASAEKATLGEIEAREHWRAIARRLKIRQEDITAVQAEFFGGDAVDWSIVQFLRDLRPRFQTGLISNAWSDMREYLVRSRIVDAFDHVVISAEVGMAKPEPGIYRLALEQARVEAGEAVFVDDAPVNVEACRQIGMRGILFDDPQEAMTRLQQMLNSGGM